MSRITTIRLEVPQWERVVEVPESETHWPGDKPLDLRPLSDEALDAGHLLVALRTDNAGTERPYGLSGAAHPYYAFHSPPEGRMEVPGIGRVDTRYGFHPAVPTDLDAEYDIDPDEMDFQVFTDGQGGIGLLQEAGGREHMLRIGEEGDALMAVMMRLVAIVHVLDSLDGIRNSGVLPYDKDTLGVAHQRIGHVLRWHFETSRTRPIFA